MVRKLIGVFCVALLCAPLSARADSLYLQPFAPEAQFLNNVSTNYTITGDQGVFTSSMTGLYKYFATDLNASPAYKMGSLNITVHFEQVGGHFVVDLDNSSNSLTVLLNGTPPKPVFLSTQLLAFGWDSVANPQFELLWDKDKTSGAPEVLSSPLSFIGAIIAPSQSTTTGLIPFQDFDHPFNYPKGTADVFLTPTPTSANGGVLLGMLSMGMLLYRRRGMAV